VETLESRQYNDESPCLFMPLVEFSSIGIDGFGEFSEYNKCSVISRHCSGKTGIFHLSTFAVNLNSFVS